MSSQQSDYGVQWKWSCGCCQTVRRGAGYHDPSPGGCGEANWCQHHPGNTHISDSILDILVRLAKVVSLTWTTDLFLFLSLFCR